MILYSLNCCIIIFWRCISWRGFLPFCHLFCFNYWPVSLSSRKGVCYFPLWFSFECIYVQRALYVFLLHMNMNIFMDIWIKNSSAGCTISRFPLPGLFFFPQRKFRQDDCSSHKYYQLQSKNQEIMNHKKKAERDFNMSSNFLSPALSLLS